MIFLDQCSGGAGGGSHGAQGPRAACPRHDRKHKLDLLGAGLMMASAIPLLLALHVGAGRAYPWLSLPIAALVVASGVAVDALCLAV